MTEAIDWPGYHASFREAAEQAGFNPTILTELEVSPVLAWERQGGQEDRPRIYISAGIHGDEPAGPLALLEMMRGGFFTDAAHWWVCPTLNPTGLAASTRENAGGIDLNRDYWTRGSLEITAHSAWIDSLNRPDLFISLHEDWETSGFYFYEINLGDDRPERARHILDAVSAWFPPEQGPLIDGHDIREAGWIYHASDPDLPEGWPEAIYLAKKGCPVSFTFETPSSAPLYQRIAAHAAAARAACEGLLGQFGKS